MYKFKFPKMSWNATKLEEVEFIQALQASVSKNSFMGSLLSDGLVKWFGEQVGDDFSADLFNDYKEVSKLLEDTRDGLREVNKEWDDLKIQVNSADNVIDGLLERNDLLVKNFAGLHNRLVEAQHIAEALSGELFDLQESHKAEIALKDAEIARVKAILWDMEHK